MNDTTKPCELYYHRPRHLRPDLPRYELMQLDKGVKCTCGKFGGALEDTGVRFYELHESDGTTVETSGACAHCGQPNQQTDNVCGTHKMTGWRIWIVRFLFPDWRQFQKLPVS